MQSNKPEVSIYIYEVGDIRVTILFTITCSGSNFASPALHAGQIRHLSGHN